MDRNLDGTTDSFGGPSSQNRVVHKGNLEGLLG